MDFWVRIVVFLMYLVGFKGSRNWRKDQFFRAHCVDMFIDPMNQVNNILWNITTMKIHKIYLVYIDNKNKFDCVVCTRLYTPFPFVQPHVCPGKWPTSRNDYPNLLRWPIHLSTKLVFFFCVHVKPTIFWPFERGLEFWNFKQAIIKIVSFRVRNILC